MKEPPVKAFAPLPSAPPVGRGTGQHILPPRANRNVPSDEEGDFTKKRRRNWAKLISKVYFDDPCLCTSCGEEMKIIAAITSPGQDDVIEGVLRHLKIWDPPWKREHRARGPPSGDHGAQKSHEEDPPLTDPIDPERGFEDYAVDPPWSEES